MITDQLRAAAVALASPFVAGWEAFRAVPYLCPTGHWTIGFGATEYPDGSPVKEGDPAISVDTALDMLRSGLIRETIAISKTITRTPTVHQLAALLSFAYNVGVYGAERSTLVRLFDQGYVNATAAHFLDWDKGRDKSGNLVEIPGLRNRREAEQKLFETPDKLAA